MSASLKRILISIDLLSDVSGEQTSFHPIFPIASNFTPQTSGVFVRWYFFQFV